MLFFRLFFSERATFNYLIYNISLNSEYSLGTIYANENRSQFEANKQWILAKNRFFDYFLMKFGRLSYA
jgi:hypothetical protein